MEPKDAFKFCPKCGGELIPKKDNFLECSRCGYHLYINLVSANGVIIENNHEDILLTKRKFEPSKGLWDIPGGFIQPNESVDESIEREIKEELGVEIEGIKLLGTYTDRYLYQGINIYTLIVVVTAKIRNGEIKCADDVSEYKFFSKEQLLDQKFSFKYVKEALQDYLKASN